MCNTTVLGHLSRLKHLVLTFTLWLFLYFFSSIHLVPRLATDFLVRFVDLTGNFEIKICNHLTFHRQRKFDHLHSLIDSLISFCSSLSLWLLWTPLFRATKMNLSYPVDHWIPIWTEGHYPFEKKLKLSFRYKIMSAYSYFSFNDTSTIEYRQHKSPISYQITIKRILSVFCTW